MVDTSKFAATFELIDGNGDGLISAAELKHVMEALGGEITDEAAARAVEVLDSDGDGLVSLEELAGYLAEQPADRSVEGSGSGSDRQ